jgi:hypothetical protein
MTVGAISKPLRDLIRQHQSELAGQDTTVGMYANTRTKEDIAAGSMRLVRTYRVERTDMNRMLRNRAEAFGQNVGKAKQMVSREWAETMTKGAATPDQKAEALEGRQIRLNQLAKMREIFAGAQKIAPEWYGSDEGRALLLTVAKDVGLDRYEQGYVVGLLDDVPPYQPRPALNGFDIGDWNR